VVLLSVAPVKALLRLSPFVFPSGRRGRKFPFTRPLSTTLSSSHVVMVRRAKLYYLRNLRGKKAKIKEKRDF
jgi:hypothetical protein